MGRSSLCVQGEGGELIYQGGNPCVIRQVGEGSWGGRRGLGREWLRRKVQSCLFTHHIILSSTTVSLVGLEGGGGNVTRLGRFANYLRSILPHADVTLTEMTARAIGQLALAEGTYTAEYVEFEVKRALEWILGSENKKLAAVS